VASVSQPHHARRAAVGADAPVALGNEAELGSGHNLSDLAFEATSEQFFVLERTIAFRRVEDIDRGEPELLELVNLESVTVPDADNGFHSVEGWSIDRALLTLADQ
jgi:hypothetical protein